MRHLIALLLLSVIPLGGCSLVKGDLSSLPGYAAIGSGILEAELRVDLATLSNEDLEEREEIMSSLAPTLHEVADLADAYYEDVLEEIARRQVVPPAPPE